MESLLRNGLARNDYTEPDDYASADRMPGRCFFWALLQYLDNCVHKAQFTDTDQVEEQPNPPTGGQGG